MFEATTGTFAANKVLRELGKSGAIGHTERTVIFPTTKLDLVFSDPPGVYMVRNGIEGYIPITEGQKYKVVWNGVEHEYTASFVEAAGAYILGNQGLLDPEGLNTGESFMLVIISTVDDEGNLIEGMQVMTHDPAATLAIYTETIRPIDPKYLPEGGFGYTTVKDVNLIPDQVAKNLDDGGWYLNVEISPDDYWVPELVLGREYTVTVNGAVYKSVAKKLGDNYIYIGDVREQDYDAAMNLTAEDVAAANVEHTGEPWCVIWWMGMDTAFYMFDGTTEATLSITYLGEVAVPIDPKFLPEQEFPGGSVLTFADIFAEAADGLSQTIQKMLLGGTKFYPGVFTNDFWDKIKPGQPFSVVSDGSMMGYQLVDTAPKVVFDDKNRAVQLIMSFDVVYGEDIANITQYSMRITLCYNPDFDMMYVEVNQKPLTTG